MKIRLRTWISLSYALGTLGCVLLMLLCCRVMLRPLFVHDSSRMMKSYSLQLSQSYEDEPEELEALFDEMYDSYLISGAIVGPDNVTKYGRLRGWGSDRGKILTGKTLEMVEHFREEGMSAHARERYNQEGELRKLCYLYSLEDGSVLLLTKSVKGVDQDVSLVSFFLLLTGLLSTLICGIIWRFVTAPFHRSIERMSAVTRDISQLNFQQRVNYQGNLVEVDLLSHSIDRLSERLEESIAEIQTDLERQKEVLRNLSHEVKTPLTIIKGYTESIQLVVHDQERVERYCGIILEECDMLERLSTEMMEVSTLEHSATLYQQTFVDARELFQHFLPRLDRSLDEMEVQVRWEDAILFGSLPLLERAVSNYLNNAQRYRTPGTVVLLRGAHQEGCYRISVLNEGEPIPEPERIWDAFYRGDKSRKRQGSFGIGLSIVRQIAAIHQGRAGYIRERGRNCFYLELPLPTQADEPQRPGLPEVQFDRDRAE